MNQSWQIYNISKGLTLNAIYDDNEILNKSISIDVLLYLLQSKWRYDKIVITGNLDDTYNSSEDMKDYVDYFLSNYNIKYKDLVKKKDYNLYNLDSNGFLPKDSHNINISVNYIDLFYQFYLELDSNKNSQCNESHQDNNDETRRLYINDNGNIIKYEEINTYYTYVFVNHTKCMYVLFDSHLLQSNFLGKRYNMTLPTTNNLVKKIVLYLLASHSSFGRGVNDDSLPPKINNDIEEYIGMWCGDAIGFEKMNQKIASYENISNIFNKKSRTYSLSN